MANGRVAELMSNNNWALAILHHQGNFKFQESWLGL